MPLITTVDQLCEYVSVGKDLSWKSIKPSLFGAEQKYIMPFLGKNLYDYLCDNVPTNAEQDPVALACNAAAKFALWLYVIPGGKQIDDMGIYEAKTNNMWRLSEADIEKLRDSYAEEAMEALEMLLNLLEANAVAAAQGTSQSNYTAYNWWFISPTRKRYADLLINSSEVFSEYVELYRSTLTFIFMRDNIRHVEKHQIAPLLGNYYTTLKTLATPAGNDAVLLDLVREALAKLAAARSLRRGFFFLANERLCYGIKPHTATAELVSEYESDGQNALERLRAKLEEFKPSGYTPLVSLPADTTMLRKPSAKIILA
jgi:hypothetical protein